MDLLAGLLAILIMAGTTLNTGFAAVYAIRGLRLSRTILAYAVIAGFVANGFLGGLLWVTHLTSIFWAALGVIAINALAVFAHRRMGTPLRYLAAQSKAVVLVWLGASSILFCLAHVEPSQPNWLQDGPYVYKNWTLPVRVQFLVGDMPADNALPAMAGEMMARNLSFRDVRPLAPGQEVSNRPLLMSAIYLPYRLILGGGADHVDTVPTLHYVGTDWPDLEALITDRSFSVYLATAITANAALIIAVILLLQFYAVPYAIPLAIFGFAVTPYFILHTIFTWPKSLAAFILSTAFIAALERRQAFLIASLAALAYWAHSYAILFTAGYCMYLFTEALSGYLKDRTKKSFVDNGRSLSLSAACVVSILLPWFIWTRYGLKIEADLLSQNAGLGLSLIQQIQIKLANIGTIFSFNFMDLEHNSLNGLNLLFSVHLASAIGIIPFLLLPAAICVGPLRFSRLMLFAVLLPAAAVTLLFGVPNPPLLHGWQAAIPILFVSALAFINSHMGRKMLIASTAITLAVSVIALGCRGYVAYRFGDQQSVMLHYLDHQPVDLDSHPVSPISVQGVSKMSLFTAPPAEYTFGPFNAHDRLALRLDVAVHEEVYDYSGADVTRFIVTAHELQSGETYTVFDQSLDVRNNPNDRGWHGGVFPLPAGLDQAFTLTLVCDPGPAGQSVADWCIWGEPAIIPTH
ncbi:hypothetical protein [uncultured Maricaulis sp.]|uniref:hypothetical protein n=1 Tax=uncultured Maricaulis sp. TaxID=174710 RepID=UPI0030D7A49C|tara:strand:+ start:65396 stop:67462 length:2067 start_codon:yes stop_codon:yes gene_type:complete